MQKHNDKFYMQKAIKLAKKGKTTTTPNPCVGCVIVKNNKIIGKGYHKKAGENHAEINALTNINSNDSAENSTVYVTLEPCSNFGKTPPCVDALIKAKVKKVVIGSIDRNPEISSIEKLKNAGIKVKIGVLENKCKNLNNGFFKRMQENIPFVTLKLGVSLDSKIATKTVKSKWITNELARKDVQKYRSKSCAILTSSATVIADNPSMNVRISEKSRQPIRIVLDTNLTTSPNSKIFNIKGKSIVFHSSENIDKINKYTNSKIFFSPTLNKKIDLNFVLKKLAELEINDVFIEAGGILAGQFIKQNLVDEIILYKAPIILGNLSKPAFDLDGVLKISEAYKFKIKKIKKISDNIKIILQKTKG